MTPDTVAALAAINRRFYSREAEAFDRTRDRGWQGWRQVVEILRDASRTAAPRVLDLGCGNGRFARYLEAHLGKPFEYLGVDGSLELLEAAQSSRLRDQHRFEYVELLGWLAGKPDGLDNQDFDVVAVFGVMHHVPSFALRRRLLEHGLANLAPGGLLAVTFWQLRQDPRFERRLMPWTTTELDLDPETISDLEAGDHLLRWGGDERSLRYCHETEPAEIDRLLHSLPAQLVKRYRADGPDDRLNEYVVLQAE